MLTSDSATCGHARLASRAASSNSPEVSRSTFGFSASVTLEIPRSAA